MSPLLPSSGLLSRAPEVTFTQAVEDRLRLCGVCYVRPHTRTFHIASVRLDVRICDVCHDEWESLQ